MGHSKTIYRFAPRAGATLAMTASAALILACGGDDDNPGNAVPSAAEGTVASSAAVATELASPMPTIDPVKAAKTRLDKEFKDKAWYGEIDDIVNDHGRLAVVMKPGAPLTPEVVREVCTFVAATAFANTEEVHVNEVSVRDGEGKDLVVSTGPQC